MGKVKVVAIGLGVLFMCISALQTIGANVEADFAAGDDMPSRSADTESAAVVQQSNTLRDQLGTQASATNDGEVPSTDERGPAPSPL